MAAQCVSIYSSLVSTNIEIDLRKYSTLFYLERTYEVQCKYTVLYISFILKVPLEVENIVSKEIDLWKYVGV
jgi:hypothetical protein